jgi:hypothetical protein
VPSTSQGSGREHAELVADAVAERRQLQRGHRIEEAGRQPPEAAVAERRVGLHCCHILQGVGVLAHRGGHIRRQIQRGQRIAHGAADQEFHRQVVHAPRLVPAVGAVALHPAPGQALARELRHGVHHVGAFCTVGRHADGFEQVAVDG